MRPIHYALRHSYPDGKSLDRATQRQDLLNLLRMFGAIQTTVFDLIFGFSDFTIRELADTGVIVIQSDYLAPGGGPHAEVVSGRRGGLWTAPYLHDMLHASPPGDMERPGPAVTKGGPEKLHTQQARVQDNSRMKKTYTGPFKVQVVLEVLQETETLS